MWHMTCDQWHVGGWTLSKNVSSPALTVFEGQCLADSEQKYDLINESMKEWITKVFKEQTRLHRVCFKKVEQGFGSNTIVKSNEL